MACSACEKKGCDPRSSDVSFSAAALMDTGHVCMAILAGKEQGVTPFSSALSTAFGTTPEPPYSPLPTPFPFPHPASLDQPVFVDLDGGSGVGDPYGEGDN